MPIEWPDKIAGDDSSYKRLRDKAVCDVEEVKGGHVLIAVSGWSKSERDLDVAAAETGKIIAASGSALSTGGLGGLMFQAAVGFLGKKSGKPAIGIVPGKREKWDEARELANSTQVTKDISLISTKLAGDTGHKGPDSRNHVLIATADAVICLPGTGGSIAELEMAVEWYGKPVLAYLANTTTRKVDNWRNSATRLSQRGLDLASSIAEISNWLSQFKRS